MKHKSIEGPAACVQLSQDYTSVVVRSGGRKVAEAQTKSTCSMH